MNMPAKLRLQLQENPRTADVGARGRAHDRGSWAVRQSKSHLLAPHFGVSAGRIRHQSSDDLSGPVTCVCSAAADPECDGEAIRIAIEESVEDRYLDVERAVLEARLFYLRTEAEHSAQAQQDRASMTWGPGTNDALRKHARILLEMAAIRVRLGLEERVN